LGPIPNFKRNPDAHETVQFNQAGPPPAFRNEAPLDIIPFGGIADAHEAVSWPPEHDIEMRIAGFQECYRHAISVIISARPKLVVKVVSLAGLAILKLVAWDDSNERRSKDAADLFIIIKSFIEAGNMDRFFEEVDILPAEESDYDRSSARFLGREMARIAGQATKAMLVGILEREAAASRGHQIAMDVLGRVSFQKESYERVETYFNALLRGLLD
jgi:predicted nucleotidyltransferase